MEFQVGYLAQKFNRYQFLNKENILGRPSSNLVDELEHT